MRQLFDIYFSGGLSLRLKAPGNDGFRSCTRAWISDELRLHGFRCCLSEYGSGGLGGCGLWLHPDLSDCHQDYQHGSAEREDLTDADVLGENAREDKA